VVSKTLHVIIFAFLTFFSKAKKCNFFAFFALLHTFSRTMARTWASSHFRHWSIISFTTSLLTSAAALSRPVLIFGRQQNDSVTSMPCKARYIAATVLSVRPSVRNICGQCQNGWKHRQLLPPSRLRVRVRHSYCLCTGRVR